MSDAYFTYGYCNIMVLQIESFGISGCISWPKQASGTNKAALVSDPGVCTGKPFGQVRGL